MNSVTHILISLLRMIFGCVECTGENHHLHPHYFDFSVVVGINDWLITSSLISHRASKFATSVVHFNS